MHPDALQLFHQTPAELLLYEAAEAKICAAFPAATLKVTKTQVSFANRYGFAYLWPPRRKIKGRPGLYIVLTFGLGYRLDDPRIIEAVEPYPNRWTHHVLISSPADMDEQIMAWLQEAYDFSLHKGRHRR